MPNKRFIFEVPVECTAYPPEDRTAIPELWAKQVIDQVLLDAIRQSCGKQLEMIRVNRGVSLNSEDCDRELTGVYNMYVSRQAMLEKMRKEVILSRIEECVEWTDTKPTKEGFYWWKETPESTMRFAARVRLNPFGNLEGSCLATKVDSLEEAKLAFAKFHLGLGIVNLQGVWSVAEKEQ